MSSLGVRRRFAAVSLALAGSLVALSACSGADDPDADAAQSPGSVSPSASPSPTPTPSATYKPASAEGPAENVPLPVMPEEAKVESKEGLIAFARYWYELANYGYQTGDAEPLKAISGPDCFACQNLYPVITEGYSGGGWIAGAKVTVQDADSTFTLTEQGRYQATVQVVQDPLQFFMPGSLEAHRTQSGNDTAAFQLVEGVYSDGTWTAVEVVTLYAPE